MNPIELVGKRVLLKMSRQGRYGYNAGAVEEFKVLGASPLGTWLRLQNVHGSKFWMPVQDVSFVEELRDLCAERMQEAPHAGGG